jgi:putative transposase
MHEGAVIVTAATYHKQNFFQGEVRLRMLQSTLLRHAHALEWRLQAWAVFPNHYHFVAIAPGDGSLPRLIHRIHAASAHVINREDSCLGRPVRYRYWDTSITEEKSYLARLAYVHRNAERHGVVKSAEAYPYCSASWFLTQAERPFYETVMSFKIDRVNVVDDF